MKQCYTNCRAPFSIKGHSDALLFARYLIEDNQEDFLMLDLDRSSHYRVIRSIFKNAIGNILIISEEEEKSMWRLLSMKITQFKYGLIEASNMYSKSNLITSDQVVRCLEETLNEIEHFEAVTFITTINSSFPLNS